MKVSIVLIHWKIKKDRESQFKKDWKVKFKIKNRDGLVGEFLSKVESRSSVYPYITWPIACDNLAHEEQCVHYINVGIWDSHKAFFKETGRHMNDNKPPNKYEIERRRRIAVSAVEWRIGFGKFPSRDSAGTK
jgi:hypothetical protein